MDEWQRGWMRATRNRVYGVTRIGGSNPSSSAIYSTVLMAVFFFGVWAVSSVASACFQQTGLWLGHLTPLRALPLSYVVRCSQELADKTNRSIGWFCLALLLIRHLQHRLNGGVFFRRLSCLIKRCSVFFLISPKCRFCKRLTLLKCLW